MSPQQRRPGRALPWRKRLLFLTVAMLMVFGLTEAVLRVGAPLPGPYVRERFHRYLPAWNQGRHEPPFAFDFYGGKLNGVEFGSRHITINSYGFLYPEASKVRRTPDEIRIAAIGGSTTECIALTSDKRWPAILAELLRKQFPRRAVTVLNLGTSGHDTHSHIATLAQHVIALDVDAVIFLIGGNDCRLGAETDYDPMLDRTCFVNRRHPYGFLDVVVFSQTARRVRQLIEWMRQSLMPSTPYFAKAQKHMLHSPALPAEARIPPAALSAYSRNLVTLGAVGRAHGLQVLFATQPSLWKANMSAEEEAVLWMLIAECGSRSCRVKPETAAEVLATFNAETIRVCAARGYPCVDLASMIPKNLAHFYDDTHLNDHGAAVTAQVLADSLMTKGQFPPPSRRESATAVP